MKRGLRVAVDVRSMMDAATGIGRYTGQLVEDLLTLEYVVTGYAFGGTRPSAWLTRLMDRGVRLVRRHAPMRVMRHLWLRDHGPLIEDVVGDVDLVLAAETMVPRTRLPVVAIVYDTLALDHPEWFNAYVQRAAPENLERAFATAKRIITISDTVRQRLIKRHPGARVDVVMPATTAPDGSARADGDFVFFSGTKEPRKGLGRVAQALLWMNDAPRLVVCGKPGWGAMPQRAALDRLLDIGRVDDRGYVGDGALARLRERALAVVVPSLDEGFGLPLLEAMAAGCPIVASDIAVFREVAADSVLYADGKDTLAWCTALERLADDRSLRQELGARAKERAGAFSFDRQRTELAAALAGLT